MKNFILNRVDQLARLVKFPIVKSIFGNAVILGFGKSIDRALLFILFIIMARHLGVEKYGLFSVGFALTSMVTAISEFGLITIVNREVSRNQDLAKIYVDNSLAIRLILSIITIGLTCSIYFLITASIESLKIVFFLLISLIIDNYYGVIFAIFRATDRMKYQTIIVIVSRLVVFILAVIVLFSGGDVISVSVIFVIGSFTGLILSIYFYRRHFPRIQLEFNILFWKQLVFASFPLAIAAVFGMIHFRVDTLLLQTYKGEYSVGLYNAAYNAVVGAAIIAGSIMNALFPVLSSYYVKSLEKMHRMYKFSLIIMSTLGLFLAIFGGLFAKPIMLFLYGVEYSNAVVIFQILAWGVGFSFVNNLTGITLNAINKQKNNMWFVGIAAFTNILINLLLIPKIGYIGASIATVCSEALLFTIGFFSIRNYYMSTLKVDDQVFAKEYD